MELRSLMKGLALLAGAVVVLCLVVLARDGAARSNRVYESTFVSLVSDESLTAKDITTLEVRLPADDGELRWSYKRVDGLWRLPEFAGAFALNAEVDNLLTSILTSRARPVGRTPEDQSRYGLLPSTALTLVLYQNTTETLRLQVGGLHPGAAKDERYVLRGNDDVVYLLNTNPAVPFSDQEPPALLDKHILPRALPHAFPARISWRGTRSMALREVTIRTLPVDPAKERLLPNEVKSRDAKKEPTHEFIGVLSDGATRTLDENQGMLYVNTILGLEFDKIVGSISPVQVEYQKFADPVVEVTLHYNNADPISLAVSGSLIEGKYPILNRASGQVFVVSGEKVDGLLPLFATSEVKVPPSS